MIHLQPWQTRFLDRALSPDVSEGVLSIARGNGKTSLCARVLVEALTGGRLHVRGAEYLAAAGSLDQCRVLARLVRADLEPCGGWRFSDSSQRIVFTHKDGTRLRFLPCNGAGALGLGVLNPLCVADEPASWGGSNGELMFQALRQSLGKPGQSMKILWIGTVSPARPGSWWADLVAAGSGPGRHVHVVQGDVRRWRDLRHVYAVNPLSRISATFRRKLREERDEALTDSRARAAFVSFRLNQPVPDEQSVLLSLDDWQRVVARPCPPREGRPIAGVDLGSGRSWSAAAFLWDNGRVEARAYAPAIPSLQEQEVRDRVVPFSYRKLADAGVLRVDEGRRVPRAEVLVDLIRERNARAIVADRFRESELRDCKPKIPIIPRVWQWSSSSEDIKAFRIRALDGNLAIEPESVPLIAASLSASVVQRDTSGNSRLVKGAGGGRARDDVVVGLVLAAGAASRMPAPRVPRFFSV